MIIDQDIEVVFTTDPIEVILSRRSESDTFELDVVYAPQHDGEFGPEDWRVESEWEDQMRSAVYPAIANTTSVDEAIAIVRAAIASFDPMGGECR